MASLWSWADWRQEVMWEVAAAGLVALALHRVVRCPGRWGRAARSGTASRRGCRRQLVETTRKVFVMKRPMPDLVACRHTIRPPPSGCWKAEAGASQ